MSETSSPRVARRRAETRARILREASRLLVGKQLDDVSLDDIAEAADVARATVYSHFEGKDELVAAIVVPVMERGLSLLEEECAATPKEAVLALLRTYRTLWDEHRDALRVTYESRGLALEPVAVPHGRFMKAAIETLSVAEREGALRTGDAELATRTIARVAVPLLQLYGDAEGAEDAYFKGVTSLLLRRSR